MYFSKNDIDNSIYDDLLDLFTLLEWLEIIHQLFNNKVTDSLKISNKMLKYLDLTTHHKLWILVKTIIKL